MVEKKPRKTRKDKGKKRGKKRTKNPQFQRGSIDFRTIGTQQTMGQNATLLAGLISSRAVVPQYLQPQQQISTELVRYAPRDLVKNVPPPQFKPDTEQSQEETSQATQVRQAMGQRIGRLRKETEDLEEKEAVLYIKSKGLERRNIQMEEQGKKLQEELMTSSKKIIEQQDILSEQRRELISGVNSFQAQGLIKLLKEQGVEPISDRAEPLRKQLLETKGFKFEEDFKMELKKGKGGGVNVIVPIEKQDLQRAQEERPVQQTELKGVASGGGIIQVEEGPLEEDDDLLEEDEPEPPKKTPKPYKPEFLPNKEFIDKIQSELKAEEEPRQMSEIEKALQANEKTLKKNELQQTAISSDSRLAQRLALQKEKNKPKLPNRGPVGRVGGFFYDEQGLVQL